MSSSGDQSPISGCDGEVLLAVWVTPGAQRSQIVGTADGRLKIKIHGQAHEGQANTELIRFLAECSGVPRSQIEIIGGQSGRRKLVRLRGASLAGLRARIVS